MKKISILVLLAFSAVFSYSQTLDEINEMMGKKDFAGARAAIDKYMADPKNNSKADGWYYKGRVYNSLSNDKTTPEANKYELKSTAFEAFKKNQQLDPKDIYMKMETYGSYLDLYFGLYDLGANLFNGKQYELAYNAFKKALEVEDFILSKKYTYTDATLHPLDTALVLNTAIAASQSKKDEDAIFYYRKLVDGNVAGDGYKEVYDYLVDYYDKKEDPALQDMLTKARKSYPGDNYWNEVELRIIKKKDGLPALLAKYDEIIAREPANYAMAYNYSVELYNSIYGKDAKPDDAKKEKLTTVLKAAIANDQGIDGTVLMANHLYNMAADYQNQVTLIKGTKPEDVKKKNDLKALANKKMDECIMYSEKAVAYFDSKTGLKPLQVANFKIVLQYLSEIYDQKGNKAKAAEYDKKRASIK